MSALQTYYSKLPRIAPSALQHIPGTDGWPLVGNSLEFLANPLQYARNVLERYGPVSRANFLFERRVNLISAEANELVLLDRAGNFSAYLGWEPVLGMLFPRGLMLRDADDHRYHRRLMQPAFRKEALAAYLARMTPRIAQRIAQWSESSHLKFYPEVKRLTLEVAADVFLDVQLQSEIDQVSRDFVDLVEASNALLRVPVIGRKFERGLAGRRRLAQLIASRIAARRGGQGTDLLSQLSRAEDENGQRYSDTEIVDHLIFLMMAAHDTTTSALTTIVYALATQPEWQARLRDTIVAMGKPAPEYEDLAALEEIEWVLRESLRLYPPLTVILRRTLRDIEFQGHRIPAGTSINIFPVATHRLAQWWSDPDRFDPERFSPARAEHRRHPFAWAPFGGGAHMCLGLHFAEMQVKAVLYPLLAAMRISVAENYGPPFKLAPIVHPRDGLPVRLERN
ncbi:cytochrome P450 [Panacagrimonas sp.]|uniref:cytochrome P450 n=1 Tax=Panacagrimonas sp. TaxID=2480088 RepID=UPI003B5287B2